jgi:hypothetical protein
MVGRVPRFRLQVRFLTAAIALTAFALAARAADDQPASLDAGKVVIQSKGPGVPVAGTVAPLHLSDV